MSATPTLRAPLAALPPTPLPAVPSELSQQDAPPLLGWGAISSPALCGLPDAPRRLGGLCLHPAAHLLGLRAWRDTFEGLLSEREGERTPWVVFDLEKMLRMLLRQSTLALEVLGILAQNGEEARFCWIASQALARPLVLGYAQRLGALGPTPEAVRLALTAALLARELTYMPHLPTAIARWDHPALDPLRALPTLSSTERSRCCEAALAHLAPWLTPDHPETLLPPRPSGYDALHHWLIAQRLEPRT